jgi:hypothetical protein
MMLTRDSQSGSGAQCRMAGKLLLKEMFGDGRFRRLPVTRWNLTDREPDDPKFTLRRVENVAKP